ncbi:MAG: hypothetical protein ICV81_10730, partial [Flavisolibacter sp.]|nr:hypothetical protein [Flavisolibacter sp.]
MQIIQEKSRAQAATTSTTKGASAYVLRISLTAALAGLIFGFDTVVISGANLPIKQLWHTSP